MSTNKFEKCALTEVKQIDEGLALSLLKFFFKAKVKKSLKKLANDPNFKANIDDLEYHAKELKRRVKAYEKEYGRKPELWNM